MLALASFASARCKNLAALSCGHPMFVTALLFTHDCLSVSRCIALELLSHGLDGVSRHVTPVRHDCAVDARRTSTECTGGHMVHTAAHGCDRYMRVRPNTFSLRRCKIPDRTVRLV